MLSNRTTIESLAKHTTIKLPTSSEEVEVQYVRNPYDVGKKANTTQVLGDSLLLALLPIATTKGDGITFPVRTIE